MATDTAWLDIGWVDLGIAGFLLLSVLTGLLRGFVFELMSLIGWFVAYLAVVWLSPELLAYVRVGPSGSTVNQVIAVASVFVLTLVAWGLLARLLRSLIRSTPLGGVDRLLGGVFGSVRGVLVLLVVALLVGLTPWSRSESWQRSRAVPWLEAAVRLVEPYLPFQLHHQQTPRGGTYVRHRWRDLQEPGQPADL